MNAFHDQFTSDPDPDMAKFRRLWKADKPILVDAVATFAPPYPSYPKRKSKQLSLDPSCASAREISDKIEVQMYNNINGFGDYQENAWTHFVGHTAEIEVALRRKLFAMHKKSLQQFLENDLSYDKKTQNYWAKIAKQIEWNDSSAIDHLYKLVAIGLLDDGLDECGFTSFEFQTGWDHDHGMSLLMHRSNVLVAGGMSEYTYFQSSLVPAIKSVQSYDLDEGDFSILDA